MIAATFGALNDALGASGESLGPESPITNFKNFEQLEFKGQKDHQHLAAFLAAMKEMANQRRAKTSGMKAG